MSKIHVLSEHLTNMIAAGEVVERPAGIVKECVENSIDAHAQTIDIEVYQGGIERLVIRDDGIGMDYKDAKLAFQRHATSKIISQDDLFNIQTMGFRGEALPSIASVAKVELKTNNGTEGTLIRYSYGDLLCQEETSCPRGTQIDISGLFIKTPARFKHLKSPSYEFSVIADLVNKMALSHPEIRFTLSHEGRVVFKTSGNKKIPDILYQMYGKEVAENAIPFESNNDDFHIHGYCIQPKINRATKYFMFVALNMRLIRSVPIQKAILEAYSSYLPVNRFPIVVLQIDSDTQLVDVNVHPNKWEVRLSKQNEALHLITETIKKALQNALKTPSIKPKQKSMVFQQETLEFDEKPEPIYQEEAISNRNNSFIDKAFEEFESENPKVEENIISYECKKEDIPEPETQGYDFFKHLKVIGQLKESYILCENPEGLVIIDQHAAQERYHYEMLKKALDKPCTSKQPLMVPIQLDVSSDMFSTLDAINKKTSFFGLEFEAFGKDQWIVREIPLWFQDVHEKEFLYDILDYFVQDQNVDMAHLRKHVLATMACHSSIRFHRALTHEEMEHVILDLQKCEQPYHCPHGRPTVITMSDSELRKEFERG